MNSATMRAMRAESFTGYGGLKSVEAPRPRRAGGRVLVRITAASSSKSSFVIGHSLLVNGGWTAQ